ncbi:inositol 2-dehydrogenase [Paenibacillus azoreducens]|uniref:inositol 2-dehydrogenase n=1 Tax=Paenibacillus azoreducens TaxID=116718 RepID=UPI0039F46DAA
MSKLKMGIIGLGRMGMEHAKHIAANASQVEPLAACALDDEQLAAAKELGFKTVYKDYKEMLDKEDIEAIVVASPTDLHTEMCAYILQHPKKIHVFCEKPLDTNVADETESLKIYNLVKQSDAVFQIGFNRRMDRQYRAAYEQIQEGKIGEPQIVKITSRDPFVIPIELIKRIGGLLVDFTMHDFDMARYMMGSNIKEVYAKGGVLIEPELKEIGDIDTLALVIEFENGAFGLIDNSRQAVYGYDVRVEVFGSEGMLKVENVNKSTVEYYNKDNAQLKNPSPIFMERYEEAYISEMNSFIQSIQNGTPVVCSIEDVILAQRAAAAGLESLRTGKPVRVNNELTPAGNN